MPSESKSCPQCQKVLEMQHFAQDYTKANGRKSICKPCDRAKARRYYQANRERVLARMRRERERAA